MWKSGWGTCFLLILWTQVSPRWDAFLLRNMKRGTEIRFSATSSGRWQNQLEMMQSCGQLHGCHCWVICRAHSGLFFLPPPPRMHWKEVFIMKRHCCIIMKPLKKISSPLAFSYFRVRYALCWAVMLNCWRKKILFKFTNWAIWSNMAFSHHGSYWSFYLE